MSCTRDGDAVKSAEQETGRGERRRVSKGLLICLLVIGVLLILAGLIIGLALLAANSRSPGSTGTNPGNGLVGPGNGLSPPPPGGSTTSPALAISIALIGIVPGTLASVLAIMALRKPTPPQFALAIPPPPPYPPSPIGYPGTTGTPSKPLAPPPRNRDRPS